MPRKKQERQAPTDSNATSTAQAPSVTEQPATKVASSKKAAAASPKSSVTPEAKSKRPAQPKTVPVKAAPLAPEVPTTTQPTDFALTENAVVEAVVTPTQPAAKASKAIKKADQVALSELVIKSKSPKNKAASTKSSEPQLAVSSAISTQSEPTAPKRGGKKTKVLAETAAPPTPVLPDVAEPVLAELDGAESAATSQDAVAEVLPAAQPVQLPKPKKTSKPLPKASTTSKTKSVNAELSQADIVQADVQPVEAQVTQSAPKRQKTARQHAVQAAAVEPIDNAAELSSAETISETVSSAPSEPVKHSNNRRGRKATEPVEPQAEALTVTLAPNAEAADSAAELQSGGTAEMFADAEPDTEPALHQTPSAAPPRPAAKSARIKAGAKVKVQPLVEVAEVTEPEVAQPQPAKPQGNNPHAVSDEAKELIIEQLRKLGRPVHVRDFERTFTRQGREKLGIRRDLAGLLEALTRSGEVIRTRRHTYGLPEAMNLVRGRFQASSGGFGFVIPDSGGDDFYIREGETLEAWNGDIVLIRSEGKGGPDRHERSGGGRSRRDSSPTAAVVRIVSRAYSQLVGSLDHQATYAFLKPDDHRARHRIVLMPDGTEGLPNGARVVTQLFWPEDTGEDEVYGEIVRVLGNTDDPATETQAVVVKYGLRDDFPDEVVAEAEQIPRQLPESALKGRLDLRDYHIFTVDGSDAKDFDDAIHIQATPEGNFVVGIHIADVSHYVTPGTPLDVEAYTRATSVYLPGKVLPMLPEHLSNGVCSLVEGEDRLTMSAMIELSGDGDILTSTFTPSVIRSKARLTYDEVQAYSEAVATLQGNARILEGDLHLLLKITAKLRQKRLREGSLDFKLREVKVDVDKDGHMQLIPLREETARGMIEDLMLLANKAVAHFLLEKNVPTLYRIHEEPTMARFQEVTGAVGRMGLGFPGGEPTPQAYQAVLKAVRGTSQESVVNTLLLRSMQQAKYAEENLGHFGLAFAEYLHFTSPIRRYPDLLVHRALKAALSGPVSDRVRSELAAPLAEQGRHTSERERTASEAERDLTKYYQAKWAQEHLNESFEGRVSGVIASGLFVVLENGVEGRLHISNLDDDYYFYIEDASILKGRTNGRIFRIGDHIAVTINGSNPLARQIDFTQADLNQENDMDGNDNRPRARRREDREVQKREKLSSFLPRTGGEAAEETTDTTPQESTDTSTSVAGAPAPRNQPAPRREAGPRESRDSRPDGRSQDRNSDRSRSSVASGPQRSSGGYRRRVVTLDRPRNEHLRPVNVTVQRMYFGDWTMENMPPEEHSGREGGYSGNQQNTFRGRTPSAQQQRGERPRSSNPRNERPREQHNQRPPQQAAENSTPAGVPSASTPESAAEEARRRRRRRGRRGGSNPSGQS